MSFRNKLDKLLLEVTFLLTVLVNISIVVLTVLPDNQYYTNITYWYRFKPARYKPLPVSTSCVAQETHLTCREEATNAHCDTGLY